MAGAGPPDPEYAEYLMRLYGGDPEVVRQQRRPMARSISGAERLSRNRAAKRAATDVTLYNHLSTMYHMNRRIYESYSKSSTARSGQSSSRSGGSSGQQGRPAYDAEPPRVAAVSRALSPCSSMPRSRPGTAPPPSMPHHLQMQQADALHTGVAVPAGASRPGTAVPLPPPPPSYIKRHVQNTAAALKTAILDEICEHRIYEASRLRALFRSYLTLNSGEAFYPTLAQVVDELRAELGVA